MASPKPSAAQLGTPDDIEQQFYDALQHGDIERLMAVGPTKTTSPACTPAVRAWWARGPFGRALTACLPTARCTPSLSGWRRVHTDAAAVHSVVERVRVMTNEGPQSAWVVATNVYVKTGLGWRLVVHHASPGSQREAQDIAEPASVLH